MDEYQYRWHSPSNYSPNAFFFYVTLLCALSLQTNYIQNGWFASGFHVLHLSPFLSQIGYNFVSFLSLLPLLLSLYSSISSIRSSPSREASAVTWTALMVPASGELTTVSIFMAERTHSGWPFSTFEDNRGGSQNITDTVSNVRFTEQQLKVSFNKSHTLDNGTWSNCLTVNVWKMYSLGC